MLTGAAPSPSRASRLSVTGFLALLLAGQTVAFVTDSEKWPFSPFPMYTSLPSREGFTDLRLYGLSRAADPAEVPLYQPRQLSPLRVYTLRATLRNAIEQATPPGTPPDWTVVDRMLHATLRRYETLRARGAHDGVALDGLRLYDEWWRLDPWARNVGHPERRTLLREVRLAPGADARRP